MQQEHCCRIGWRRHKHPIWYQVELGIKSVLTRMFSMPEMPSERAAISTMRFVIDLEPGKVTTPLRISTGLIVTEPTARTAGYSRQTVQSANEMLRMVCYVEPSELCCTLLVIDKVSERYCNCKNFI